MMLRATFTIAIAAVLTGTMGCRSERDAAVAAAAESPAPMAVADNAITPEQAIASKTDLWGEAALRQPGGPTYEYFEGLLPPLRYVDADFRHYPIVLSAPGSPVKGRLVSNGSAINALARQPNWEHEAGVPVRVLFGVTRESFGSDLARLEGPRYVDGFRPIVQLAYTQDGDRYGQEVFASTEPELAAHGAVAARFDFPAAGRGRVELRFETGYEFLPDEGHAIRDASGRLLAAYDDRWEYNKFRSCLTSKPDHAASAVVMVFTKPAPPAALGLAETPRPATTQPGAPEEELAGRTSAATRAADHPGFDLTRYEAERERCVRQWDEILATGTSVDVPERVVNNAWRSLIVAQYGILAGQQLNYSAGNQYARQYANETGDSIRSLTLWGHSKTAREALPRLFRYQRPQAVLHDAAFKLEDLADYFFQTRDTTAIEELRLLWRHELDLLLSSRQSNGLLPKERYCSDIATPVNSLNNNANAWRGLRDMSVVLDECGRPDESEQLAKVAAEYRPIILAAMEKSIFRDVSPPFVPVAMDGEETPPDPITSTRLGSYWNLVVPCVLWSGVFPIDSPPATAIMDYIRTRGGLCMGMVRVQSNPGVWVHQQNIDDLYGLRYQLALLRRDGVTEGVRDADRFLVGFYGKLAQGFTRDTFIDGESTGIVPLDRFGRQIALPPNSTANASFLIQLRNALVQDWDTDDDGRADELRLCFATPRAWLEDGKEIRMQRGPTSFGEVSLQIRSELNQGRVVAELSLPERPRNRSLLRLRLPRGMKVNSASVGSQSLAIAPDGETIDLSALHGRVTVTAGIGK
jgi:hypothetical protein